MVFVAIVDLILLLPFVVTVGWLTSRLLGVHLGLWRAYMASFVGFFIGVIAAALLTQSDDNWVVIPLGIFFGVLATMPISIVLELVTRRTKPSQHRLRRWLFHPIREIKAAFAPYGRLREVLHNTRKQNLMHMRYASSAALESPDFARRLRVVLEDTGGMFVKFGQIASTRTDMLPESLTSELALLRSEVKTVPADEIRDVLESELDESVEDAFSSFDFEPLAAASIGQTHRAVLRDGTRVVVKVQRPGVNEVVRRDAAVLRLAARQLERRMDAARRVGVRALAEELIVGIEEELDYGREADAATRLRTNRVGDEGIAIPAIFTTLSTNRVLVMEEVLARTVGDADAVTAAGVEPTVLARHLLWSFLGQILHDGQYHADPHPGNVLVDTKGTIWLLDFGAVGRLDPIALDGLRGLAMGMALQDTSLLARAVRGFSPDSDAVDLRSLEADLSGLMGELTGGGGIDAQMMGEVLNVMQRHGLRPPKSISLLSRAMLTLDGTLRIISPSFDLASESTELVSADPSASVGTPQEMIQREIIKALPALETLPEHAEAIATQFRSGRLTLRTEQFAGQDRWVVERWLDRLMLVGLGGMGAITAALILLAGSFTSDDNVQIALWSIGFGGLMFSTVLLMRSAATVLRRLPLRDE
jgi:ubiquinone biosynthesis protein